jgi:cytochrome-b5 reductase
LRSYTPTTLDDTKGHFDLVVKTYPTGLMSRHLSEMKVGDSIKVRGPKGQMKYIPNMVKHLGMIAGGTGITPMWYDFPPCRLIHGRQMTQAILKNPEDKTQISLLYANNKEEDILLKSELDKAAKEHADRFQVHYILLEAPKRWNGSTGYITQEMMKERLAEPSEDSKVLLCGPPPMVKIMQTNCEALGYAKANALSKTNDQIFKF